jgi:hypothetical protein
MAIDSRYIISPSLEMYFVDKDSGFPLSNGRVYFYEDNNRTQLKDVFKLTGSPPNYSFAALPNPCSISAVGTLEDEFGNNVIPYYFPYDQNGDLQLYHVVVESSMGVPQFTRDAWPPNAVDGSSGSQTDSTLNLIPNGQFVTHNNILANPVTGKLEGTITSPITEVAPGGWTFERPVTSTSLDNVSFIRSSTYVDDPTQNPRYSIRVVTNGGSPSDSFKDLRVKYTDVNKFSSDTQKYTVFFSARTFSGPDFQLNLNIVKNYGTGGDPTDVFNVTTFNITNAYEDFQFSFEFGSNLGKIIGPNNDDFVQLAFSMPTNSSLGFESTDFVLFIGEIQIDTFPPTSDKDFVNRSIAPDIPDYNAMDLGLPIVLTKSGLDYDRSAIGKIYASTLDYQEFGELLCDGAPYRSDDISIDGIPYRRLRNKLMTLNFPGENYNMPPFGTGKDYVTASSISTDSFVISANKAQTLSSTADGAVSTGFIFHDVAIGEASESSTGLQAWQTSDDGSYYLVENYFNGITDLTVFFSSTATQTMITNNTGEDGGVIGTPSVKALLKFRSTGLPAASSYVRMPLANTPAIVSPVFWFAVDGVGTPPGVSVEKRIDLFSDMGGDDVAYCLSRRITGAQVSYIKVLSGLSTPPNSYFIFYATGQLYYVWYNLNGLGVNPNVPNGIGIPVVYSLSDTETDIKTKTIRSVNDIYYSVPDLRGLTIKGWTLDKTLDLNFQNRFCRNGARYNDPQINLPGYIGSNQPNSILGHGHETGTIAGSIRVVATSNVFSETEGVTYGSPQNDVGNIALNYIIKY